MRMCALSWMIGMVLTATAAVAEVYKWIDEGGKVNYGDKPPPGTQGARPLDEASALVSVVPGIPKAELDRLRERYDQQRLQQLEREVDELRARELVRANVLPEAVYAEGYVPVYGYHRPWLRFPAVRRPGRWPNLPSQRIWPPVRTRPLSSELRSLTPK